MTPLDVSERAFGDVTAAATPSANSDIPDLGEPPHSWIPRDLARLELDPPPPPTIAGLVYPGARHVFLGEPESLKTWAVAVLVAEEVQAGRHAVYVDAENGAALMLERFRALGLSDEELGRVAFIEPSEPLGDGIVRADIDRLLAGRRPSLVVGDSFDALLALHGLDPNATTDVEAFYRDVVQPLRAYGAAVVLPDHVPKDRERRGRFSIGSQRKTGAAEVALGFEVVQPFGRGRTGLAKVVTHKDRLGHLPRPRAAEFELRSDATTGAVSWTFRPAVQEAEGETFRPTRLMEKVSSYVAAHVREEALSRSAIEEAVSGKRDYVRQAIDLLVTEGYLEESAGPHGARVYASVTPFREELEDAV